MKVCINKIKNLLYDITEIIEKHYIIWMICFLVFQVACLVFAYIYYGVNMEVDSPSYIKPALNFISTGHLDMEPGVPIIKRTPGYIYYLALVFKLFNNSCEAAVIGHGIFCVANSFILLKTGELITGKKWPGIIAILCYVLDFTVYYHAMAIMSDVFFSFLLLSSLYFFVKYYTEKKLRYFVIGTIIMQYSLLTRPQIMYYCLILAFVLAVMWLFKKVNIKIVLIYLLIWLAVYGGWSLRNYYVNDIFTYTIANDRDFFNNYAPTVYAWEHGGYTGEKKDEQIEEGKEYLITLFEEKYGDMSAVPQDELIDKQKDIGVHYLLNHPGPFVGMCCFRLMWEMVIPDVSMLEPMNLSAPVYYFILAINFGFLLLSYLIYAIAFLSNIKKLKWIDIALFLLASYLMVSTVSMGYWRFRIDFYMPCLVGMMCALRFVTKKDETACVVQESIEK